MTDEELAAYGIVREHGELRAPGAGLKSVEQGAATSVWCAVSPQLDGKGGVYCEDCDIAALVPDDSKLSSGVRQWAIDKPTARALWDLSEQLTDLQWPNGARPERLHRVSYKRSPMPTTGTMTQGNILLTRKEMP